MNTIKIGAIAFSLLILLSCHTQPVNNMNANTAKINSSDHGLSLFPSVQIMYKQANSSATGTRLYTATAKNNDIFNVSTQWMPGNFKYSGAVSPKVPLTIDKQTFEVKKRDGFTFCVVKSGSFMGGRGGGNMELVTDIIILAKKELLECKVCPPPPPPPPQLNHDVVIRYIQSNNNHDSGTRHYSAKHDSLGKFKVTTQWSSGEIADGEVTAEKSVTLDGQQFKVLYDPTSKVAYCYISSDTWMGGRGGGNMQLQNDLLICAAKLP